MYLHYVFDLWADWWRRRHAHGDVIIVRFADDFVVGFEHQEDAQRFLAELRERFAKFGLELHPDKTRLIEFGRFAAREPDGAGPGQAGDVRLPGLHAHLREDQERAVLAASASRSRSGCGRSCTQVKDQLRRRRHQPIPEQGRWLASVVRGHTAPTTPCPATPTRCAAFRDQVTRHWHKALRRRSQRTRLNWDADEPDRDPMATARPRRCIPFPSVRFDASTQGRSPVR